MRSTRGLFAVDVGIAAAGVVITAGLGGALTRLDSWYYALAQPWFKPPDWAFGPAWTLLFTLIATSAVLGWRAGAFVSPSPRPRMVQWFVLNAVLNISWSLLFFYLQRPDWALFEVPLLWVSIALMIYHLWPYARRASLLLVPYLLWVTLAAAINLETVRLNAPF